MSACTITRAFAIDRCDWTPGDSAIVMRGSRVVGAEGTATADGDGLATTSTAAYAAAVAAPTGSSTRRDGSASGRGRARSSVCPTQTIASAPSSATFVQYSVCNGAASNTASSPIETA